MLFCKIHINLKKETQEDKKDVKDVYVEYLATFLFQFLCPQQI